MDSFLFRQSAPEQEHRERSSPGRSWRAWVWSICCLGMLPVAPAALASEPGADDLKFFETKIRPLLIEKCVDCHGAETQESMLRLDSYTGMLSGGTSGPAVTPGNLDESLLVAAISYKDDNLQMPPDGKLPEAEIELLRQWVQKGAPHPESSQTGSIMPRRGSIDLNEARKFWAFQPIVRPTIPPARQASWGNNEIDALVLARLESQQLSPNPPADKRTLIRRATFDLIGLPPTPEEINNFLADESSEAFEHVIDRLLSSPQYGVRWGRHWLDVVRYADSNGQDENQGFVDAWRYRNYVIDAFNEDKPFDRFLVEQIAGDLLGREEGKGEGEEKYEALVATGFLTLGPKVLAEKDEAKLEMDIIDEQIDVLGQAVLGLTLACARCHDHKFDPISTADYYALAGIFKSTKTMQSFKVIAKYNEQTLATPEEIQHQAKVGDDKAARQTEIDTIIKTANAELLKQMNAPAGTKAPQDAEQKYPPEIRSKLAELRGEIKQLQDQSVTLPTAMAVQEGTPADTRIHVRGSHMTLGKTVARGIPEVLKSPDSKLEIGTSESGRLQLARWLTSPDHPLTARVAVNRLWRWHFGQGLVATTDNFGKLGEAPLNPELLDWLAAEFIDSGWSIKALHKQIMLSSTYQLASTNNPQSATIDPENRMFWRSNRQRLDAESIHDSLLAVSGSLDGTPGESVLSVSKWTLVFDHTSKDATTYDTHRRAVYLPVIRNNLYDGFSLFDYATPDVTTGSRETSTVAPQALYVMNSDFFLSSSAALAERLAREFPQDESARAIRLYELALGRTPESHEVARLLDYISQLEDVLREQDGSDEPHEAAWIAACQSVLGSNEFVYVN